MKGKKCCTPTAGAKRHRKKGRREGEGEEVCITASIYRREGEREEVCITTSANTR